MIGTEAQGVIDYIELKMRSSNTTAKELEICYEMEYNLYYRHLITEAFHNEFRSRIRDAVVKAREKEQA